MELLALKTLANARKMVTKTILTQLLPLSLLPSQSTRVSRGGSRRAAACPGWREVCIHLGTALVAPHVAKAA